MSSEGKEEKQQTNHIEIPDSEEKDNPTQAEPEQESQAEGEPEPDEPVTEEEELPPPTPGELKELRQQAAKADPDGALVNDMVRRLELRSAT